MKNTKVVIQAGKELSRFLKTMEVPTLWQPFKAQLQAYIRYAYAMLMIGETPLPFHAKHGASAVQKLANLYDGAVAFENLPDVSSIGMEWVGSSYTFRLDAAREVNG